MPYRRPSSLSPAPEAPVTAVPAPPAPDTADGAAEDTVQFTPERLKPHAKTRQRLKEEDPGSLAGVEQEARTHALRTINGLRMVAPAMRLALRQETDPDKQAECFTTLMTRAHAFAVEGCQRLKLDPTQDRNRWAIAMFERLFVTTFAEGEVPEGIPAALFDAALTAASPRGEDNIVPEPLEATALVRRGLVTGLGELIREQVRFNFFRPHAAEDLRTMAQLLVDDVEEIMAAHVQPLTPEHERQTLMAALLEEGGQLMAQAWHLEAQKAEAAFRTRSKDQMERWRRTTPEGLSLKQVQTAFRQQMARLGKLMREPRGRR
jgi:hypothetical protein